MASGKYEGNQILVQIEPAKYLQKSQNVLSCIDYLQPHLIIYTMTLTFKELRKIKDSLPDGSMHEIADKLGITVETVRNYFGGANFERGESVGIHFEQGPGGGVVSLDDTKILDMAKEMLAQNNN